MKALELFIHSRDFVVVLILIYSSNGGAQNFRAAPESQETIQAVAEMEGQQSQPSLTPGGSAMVAAVADGLTTNLALSAGAVESNSLISASPIGLIMLTGMKIGLVKFSENLSEPDKRLAIKSTSALWGGAAINNIAVYFAAPPPVSIIAGLLMGVATWMNIVNKYEKEDELLAARQVISLNTEEKVADLQGEKPP
jgi:hypothetical protein